MSSTADQHYWLAEAARVRRRVNSGWWLERLKWVFLIGAILIATAMLWIRTERFAWATERTMAFALLGFGLVAALGAWWWSRSRFISKEAALIRLDDRLGLNNRLATAFSGGGVWPARMSGSANRAVPPWRASSILIPILASVVIVVAAWKVPLPEYAPNDFDVAAEPQVWEQLENWIEELEVEELIEPGSLEEIAKQVEELRDQPQEDWFGHASLEASDTLKESFEQDLQSFSRDLGNAERSLDSLLNFSNEMSDAAKMQRINELAEAFKNLSDGGLKLNETLASQLGKLDLAKLSKAAVGQMTQEQMRQLQQQLQKGRQMLGSMEGLKPIPGECKSCESGTLVIPGQFGSKVNRGPGDAPLFYGDESDLKTNRIDGIATGDLSNALPGDVLAIGETKHDEDQEAVGIKAGGAIQSTGSGGDAVWSDSLLPDEQAVLKRYFD